MPAGVYKHLPRSTPVEERFWMKVEKSDACWLWRAGHDGSGYGMFRNNGRHQHAQRVAYELTYGEIPAGYLVCHKCDNPPCVRPDHLFLGTKRDNQLDAMGKGLWVCPPRQGEHNGRAKLDWQTVRKIRENFNDGATTQELAAMFGVSNGAIWFVVKGKHWFE